MASPIDPVQAELEETLAEAGTQTKQLENILARMMKVLIDSGFQVAVDVVGMAAEIQQRIELAQRDTKRINGMLDHLEELLATFALLTSTLELDQVLEEVMDMVIKLTNCERAYLMLRNQETGELSMAIARNWDRETLSEGDAVFSRSVVMSALEQGKPIVTTNAQADQRFQNAMSIVSNHMRAILCVPLVLRGMTVGVLYADNRINQAIFEPDYIPIFGAFGTQAAIAIENARMYSRVKEDLNEALNQLESLRIEIDHSKVDRQVEEISESDFFKNLTATARSLRARQTKTTSVVK
ncbi:MAG: GAF domain-containing protein [Chloroflexota bacterium]|nr:GAF domain-containing protein [Chloroflexota bacterium]